MKKLIAFLIGCLPAGAFAQTEPHIDKDRLLNLYQTQKYSEAGDYLKTIYTDTTGNIAYLGQLGYCYLMAGNLPEAEKFYSRIHILAPDNIQALLNMASIQVRRGNNPGARQFYKKVIQADSTSFIAYKQLAGLYDDKLEPAPKMAYLTKASKLNPTDGDVAFDLADILTQHKKPFQAYSILNPALKADSLNYRLLKMRMIIELSMKIYPLAIKTGQKLMQEGDSSTFVLSNTAKAYYLVKNHTKALELFLKVEKVSEGNEGLYYSIALCYRGLEDHKKATDFMKKAIEESISPEIDRYYALLGDSYNKLGQYAFAVQAYRQSAEYKDDPMTLFTLAEIYDRKLNEKSKAIEAYRRFLKVYPDTGIYQSTSNKIKARVDSLEK